MAIDRVEVERIAGLARLRLSEAEAEAMTRHLTGILDYVRELAELDLRGVEPSVFAVQGQAPLRADEARGGLSQRVALASAPESCDGFFVVPPVIEQL